MQCTLVKKVQRRKNGNCQALAEVYGLRLSSGFYIIEHLRNKGKYY